MRALTSQPPARASVTDGRARAARHTHGQEKEEISSTRPRIRRSACVRTGENAGNPRDLVDASPRFGFGSVVRAARRGRCVRTHVPVSVRLRPPVLASAVPLGARLRAPLAPT